MIVHGLRQVLWEIRPLEPERQLAVHLIKRLGNAAAAVDIGGHIGFYSSAFARICPQVFCFEANPNLAQYLIEVLPKNVEVLNLAVSNSEKSLELRIPVMEGKPNTGMATTSKANVFSSVVLESESVLSVRATTLDSFFDKRIPRGGVSFVKIDVEGAEEAVVSGAQETIRTCRPILLIESEARHGADISNLFSLMTSQDYSVFRADPAGKKLVLVKAQEVPALQSNDRLKKKEKNFYSTEYVNNFFFVPHEHLLTLQDFVDQ